VQRILRCRTPESLPAFSGAAASEVAKVLDLSPIRGEYFLCFKSG
jgi:hypothetical protein